MVVSCSSETSDLHRHNGQSQSTSMTSLMTSSINESLRWVNERADTVGEEDRIRVYKLNRRKRYMEVTQRSMDGNSNQFYA